MFESMDKAPADPIMGITELYNTDTNPKKINLSMGVFKDEQGNSPLLDCVKEAEAKIYATEDTKAYSAIEGFSSFNDAVLPLILVLSTRLSHPGALPPYTHQAAPAHCALARISFTNSQPARSSGLATQLG